MFNFGIGGYRLASMIPEDGTLIDPMFDPALEENVLCVLAGTNDIGGDGVDGATCFSRLQTWCNERKAARPWNIRVLTLPSRRSGWQRVADYNQWIRQGDSKIDRVLDMGLGSTVETALSDPNNLTYFLPDALHLTDLGYGVIAGHVSEDLSR